MSGVNDRIRIESVLSECARRERATEITALMKRTLEQPDLISLAVGFVDQVSLPREEVAATVAALLSDRERGLSALQYGTTVGLAPLREELARRLGGQGLEGMVGPDDILITSGSQELLYLLTQVLVDPGDIVLVEAPTYFAYAAVLVGAAARAVGIASDEDGMIPAALESRLREFEQRGERKRVKMLYLMSYFSNPRGTSFSWERRESVYDIVRRYGGDDQVIPIVEDTAYRELRFEGPEIPYLKTLDRSNENVVLAGSFSKSFAPGLRTGFGVVPKPLTPHLVTQKTYHDFGGPAFCQAIMYEALKNGSYDRHVEDLRQRYREKRDLALRTIDEHWPREVKVNRPLGGMYVWAALPGGISTDPGAALFETAVERYRVLYIPGSYCYVGAAPGEKRHNEMRICYGMIDDDKMVEGLERLGRAITTVLHSAEPTRSSGD